MVQRTLRGRARHLVAAFTILGSVFSSAATLECGKAAPDASRIAVAGGSLAEILYALEEQDRIVGADRTSNYPPAALELPQIGYVRALSAEGLLSINPTLILGEHDMGPPDVVEQLERIGVDVLRVPEAFTAAGIAAKVRCVANAIGEEEAGEAMARRILADGVKLKGERAADLDNAPAGIVLLGLRGGTPIAAGRDTSGAGLLTLAGARNVFESVDGWKPLSAEALADAQPAFIVIPERGVRTAGGIEKLLDHPALRTTPAARDRRVVSMDGMAMLGFGLRTLDAAGQLKDALDSPAQAPEQLPAKQ
ncbi:MAG: ABC transporter substrate-binding protein [Pseudomonadota bacterium]